MATAATAALVVENDLVPGSASPHRLRRLASYVVLVKPVVNIADGPDTAVDKSLRPRAKVVAVTWPTQVRVTLPGRPSRPPAFLLRRPRERHILPPHVPSKDPTAKTRPVVEDPAALDEGREMP